MVLTKGDAVLAMVDKALSDLRALTQQAFEPEQVGAVFQPAASRLELFLRSTVFPMSGRRDTFHSLIEDLGGVGLPPAEVARLHALREQYNKSKHNSSFVLPLVQTMAILREAREALAALMTMCPGRCDTPVDRKITYQLQVGFWDNYVGGDTEIAISLPSDHWTGAATLDTLYIRALDWDSLKADLLAGDRFYLGEAYFPSEVWSFMKGEGDFLNAGIWEGSYRDLMRILVRYEWREVNSRLLPFLDRSNNRTSVGVALVMAALDVAGEARPLDERAFFREILQRADREYAIDTSSRHVKVSAAEIIALITQLLRAEWPQLVGPVLRNSTVRHSGPLPLLLEDHHLILEH